MSCQCGGLLQVLADWIISTSNAGWNVFKHEAFTVRHLLWFAIRRMYVMFPKTHICTGRLLSALCLFRVNALLPLEAPPLLGWLVLFCQILVGGFHTRRAGSCGCEIVRQALLSRVRVDADVLLDGGHPQPPCAVRGKAAARTGGLGTAAGAAGCGGWPDLALLLRLMGQGGGRGPAGGEGGRLMRLDDAHGCWLEVAQHFLTLKSKEQKVRQRNYKAESDWGGIHSIFTAFCSNKATE